jgi:hypothetical protein
VKRRTRFLAAAAAVVGVAAVGTGAAVARSTVIQGDESSSAIAEPDLSRASAAALSFTAQGRVTGTEVGDEESLYEVEVTLEDGSQVDVQLDETFDVVASKHDVETAVDGGQQN